MVFVTQLGRSRTPLSWGQCFGHSLDSNFIKRGIRGCQKHAYYTKIYMVSLYWIFAFISRLLYTCVLSILNGRDLRMVTLCYPFEILENWRIYSEWFKWTRNQDVKQFFTFEKSFVDTYFFQRFWLKLVLPRNKHKSIILSVS